MKKISMSIIAFALCVSAQSYGPGRDVGWSHYADSAYGSNYCSVARSVVGNVTGTADSAKGANHVNGGLFNGTSITATGLSTLDTVYTPKKIKTSGIIATALSNLDTVYTAKRIKVPGITLNGYNIDSLVMVDSTGTAKDTLKLGIGGKLFRIFCDVGN